MQFRSRLRSLACGVRANWGAGAGGAKKRPSGWTVALDGGFTFGCRGIAGAKFRLGAYPTVIRLSNPRSYLS